MEGPSAARFSARYPQVRLETVAEDRYVDVVQEGFNVAIYAKPKPMEEVVGRPGLHDRLVVVAPPDWPRPEDGDTVPAVPRAVGDATPCWNLEDGDHSITSPKFPLRSRSATVVLDDRSHP